MSMSFVRPCIVDSLEVCVTGMKRISLLLLGAGLLCVAGCYTSVLKPTPTPLPTPPPAEIAQRAGKRMLSVQSLHFVIELSGKLAYLDSPPTMALKRAEGDLVRPDQVRAIVKVSSLGVVSEVGLVQLGDEQYVTNPLNQRWERLPQGLGWYLEPALLFDPEYGIEAILGQTTWTYGADERVEDRSHFLLSGQLPGERLWPLTFGMITSGEVAVDFWVSREDDTVRRIQLVQLESDLEDPTRWLIELSAFDEPVDIRAPTVP